MGFLRSLFRRKAASNTDIKEQGVSEEASAANPETQQQTPSRVVVGECENCHRPLRVKAHAVRSEMRLTCKCGHINLIRTPQTVDANKPVSRQIDPEMQRAYELATRQEALDAWRKRTADCHQRIQQSLKDLRRPVTGESGGIGLVPGDDRERALLKLGALYFDCFILPWLTRDLTDSDYSQGKVVIIQAGILGALTVDYSTSFDTTWVRVAPILRWRFSNPKGASIIKAIARIMLSDPYWRRRWFAAAMLRRLKDEAALSALTKALQDPEINVRQEAQDALDEISGGIPAEL